MKRKENLENLETFWLENFKFLKFKKTNSSKKFFSFNSCKILFKIAKGNVVKKWKVKIMNCI